jgi:hypothetical protein
VDDAVAFRERRRRYFQAKAVAGQTVAEHHRRAAASLDLDVDLRAIGRATRKVLGPAAGERVRTGAGRGGTRAGRGHGIATHRAIV